MKFFHEVSKLGLERSKMAAFGSTRRADCTVEEDVSLNSILATKAPAATIVGKTWDMHVELVLGCSLDENLTICAESVRYLKQKGLEAIFDAEHFFDGYKANPEYAMKVLAAAAEAGADALVLCDTNGGSLPHQVAEITAQVAGRSARSSWGFTRTTTRTAPPPIRWPPSRRAPDTCRARSTAWASAAATPTCAR